MSFINLSANMNLPVPVVGIDPGPDWALNIDNCLAILDSHTHAAGSGVQITPAGLNINSDLPMGGNSLLNSKSLSLVNQGGTMGSSTIGALYQVLGDLYYNNAAGTPVKVTNGGSVAGAAGNITGLPSTSGGNAGLSWQNIAGSFVFSGDTANTYAVLDAGSLIIRNINTPGANGVTLQAPLALGAGYVITLPPLLAGIPRILSMDSAGAITSGSSGSIVAADIGAGQVTTAKLDAPTQQALAPTGALMPFAGAAAPAGWLLCDGSSYTTAGQAALFAVIAYTYGGSGANFNVPNMVNSVPVGSGGSFARGATGGEINHTLTVAEMPSHTHTKGGAEGASTSNGTTPITTATTANVTITTDARGGDGAHNNMQPYVSMNYIIKT